MHGYGKLRRCTEKLRAIVDFYLFLAAALVVIRQRIQRARRRYRWATRPTSRRLKERPLSVALSSTLSIWLQTAPRLDLKRQVVGCRRVGISSCRQQTPT